MCGDIVQSPYKFCGQPDDGPLTRPKHIVVSYTSFQSDIVVLLTVCIYGYIHTIYFVLCSTTIYVTKFNAINIEQGHFSCYFYYVLTRRMELKSDSGQLVLLHMGTSEGPDVRVAGSPTCIYGPVKDWM